MRLCSSITSFLDDEADEANAAAKGCKSNCGLSKTKQDLIKSAQKTAKDSCAKGVAPDIAKVSKGLDKTSKQKLTSLYNQNNKNSMMFDGKGKLPNKDFNLNPFKPAVALAAGGSIADLKKSEPAIIKH